MGETVFKNIAKFLLFFFIFITFIDFSIYTTSHFIDHYISFESTLTIAELLEGGPIAEPLETTRDYTFFTFNISVTVIVYSFFLTTITWMKLGRTSRKLTQYLRELIKSTTLRLLKMFSILFIFWSFFRLLPYEHFTNPYPTLPTHVLFALGITNGLLTAVVYQGMSFLWRRRSVR